MRFMVRGVVASIGAMAAAAVFAQAASATTYCVAVPGTSNTPQCSGTFTYEGTFHGALTAADGAITGPNTIVLPAGAFANSFSYTGAQSLTIEGQGQGSTVITGGLENTDASAPDLEVSSLTIDMPTAGSLNYGLELVAATALTVDHVSVTGSGYVGANGLELEAPTSTIEDSAVDVTGGSDYGADVLGAATVHDSTLSSNTGLSITRGPNSLVEHSTLSGSGENGAAVSFEDSGADTPNLIDDSLLIATDGAYGLEGFAPDTSNDVRATQLTIVGDSSSTGVAAITAGYQSAIEMTDSIVADPLAHSIARLAEGSGSELVTTNYSDYDHTTTPTGYVPGAHDTASYVTPGFIDAAAGDYRLGPKSPLLSLDPTPLGGTPVGSSESSTDLDGLPRITSGGRDLGAYQHQPVSASASVSPSHTATGLAAKFSATGSVDRPDDLLSYEWRFSDGATASGAKVSHAFATGGSHTGTVTVTDQLGFSHTASATVVVVPRPVIRLLSESTQRWREKRSKHHHKTGTTFKFSLNTAASVKLTFFQLVPGRKVSGACVKVSNRNRHDRKCTRSVRRGSLTVKGAAGVDKIRFDGKLSSGRKLSSGTYKVTFVATVDGISSPTRTRKFTIIKG